MSEPSDRELDALVAEKVMGWRRLTDGEAYPNTYDQVYPCARQAGIDRSRVTGWWFDPQRRNSKGEAEGMHPDEDSEDCPGFAPSASMLFAMEVVEKMREKLAKQGFPLIVMETPLDSCKWRVRFGVGFNEGPSKGIIAEADTLPRAICLAALKATSECTEMEKGRK